MLKRLRRKPSPPPQPQQEEEEYDDGHELRMGFFEHLEELRSRLTRAFLALALATCVGVLLAEPALVYLIQPYAQLYPEEGRQLVVLGPTGNVVAFFRVALLIGGILAIPVITYQVLMFILPGLTRKERRYVLLALPAITGLFLIGVAFAWLVLMNPAIAFLEGFQRDIFRPEWTADQYMGFVTALLFWMGVSFQIPLIFFVLSLIGLVSPGALVKNWRFAIIGSATAAAIITPTVDPINMLLVTAPLLGLYILSIFLVGLGRRISGIT
jgi:sec-independent protein translocase protein TatC